MLTKTILTAPPVGTAGSHLCALSLLILSACASSGGVTDEQADVTIRPHETLNATAWMQLSAEYEALTLQAYNTAARLLPSALADSGWTAVTEVPNDPGKPPAVIVDVDETVLDNSPFQARLIRDDTYYQRAMWNEWVEERGAPAVPGALAFLRAAAELGITVFYVTNRSSELDRATTANLVSEGFPVRSDFDVVLTRGERPDWTGDKSSRRQFVAERYRVLFLAGDDLNDFVATDGLSTDQRSSLVDEYSDRWGERWIVLPNPVYGSWERSIRNAADARTREEQIRAMRGALRDR